MRAFKGNKDPSLTLRMTRRGAPGSFAEPVPSEAEGLRMTPNGEGFQPSIQDFKPYLKKDFGGSVKTLKKNISVFVCFFYPKKDENRILGHSMDCRGQTK